MHMPAVPRALGSVVRVSLQILIVALLIAAFFGVLGAAAFVYGNFIAPLPEWVRMYGMLGLVVLLIVLEHLERTAPRYPRRRD